MPLLLLHRDLVRIKEKNSGAPRGCISMDISQYTQFIVFSSSKNRLLGISSKSMESGVNTT